MSFHIPVCAFSDDFLPIPHMDGSPLKREEDETWNEKANWGVRQSSPGKFRCAAIENKQEKKEEESPTQPELITTLRAWPKFWVY